jgi:hypothetical protein
MSSCRPLTLLLAGLAAGSVLLGQDAAAKTLSVGPGQTYKLPSEAISAAANGDTVQIAAGEYFDCATVKANDLTIVGVGAESILTDKVCGGKGILITAGKNITLRNLTLQRARVPDQNGAGIRAEGDNLTIDGVHFINNENGILAADAPDSTIRIVNSEFSKNGKCAAACAHAIYVGHIALLQVVNSHMTETRSGHFVKSRAARTEITGTTIEDGPDGTSSYLVEIPNGGSLVMSNDVLEKGPNCENHGAAIVIGAEGVTQRTSEITIRNSKFTNDQQIGTIFVRNLTATEADISNMVVKGRVTMLEGDGKAH